MPTLIGELLTRHVTLEREKLERALRLQEETGDRLGVLLVKLGFIAERDLAVALAVQFDVPLVLAHEYGDVPIWDQVTPEFLKESRVLPIAEEDGVLVVAMADPLDLYAIDALKLATGKEITPRVGVGSEIDAAIERHYGAGDSPMAQLVDEIGTTTDSSEAADIQHLRDLASEAPVVRLVNLVISRALGLGASDIHIEPFENRLKVRYRVDGELREMESPPQHSSAAVISRIKVMANLNIAERRLPQDGRIKLRIEGREVDMRVSCVPTMHGESVVIRILDKGNVTLEFPALGFARGVMSALESMLQLSHGIVLVTGPTGSGKTTTLYTALETLNRPDKKIFTVEDPVEYQRDGINQLQVRPQIGLTFASALRSILRQDPDVIMVGEIRDLETAQIAVQAALTGHKVLSTLHTNDAPSSITRLLDMGIEDYLLTSTVNGILAQRLVRVLCEECKQPYEAPPTLVAKLSLSQRSDTDAIVLHRASGCAQCGGSGYRGRIAILELLEMSTSVMEVILQHRDAASIRNAALNDGMSSMYDDGLDKALAGITTIEEVTRVTRDV